MIGLEVHIYVDARSKLFCPCSADFLSVPPGTNLCAVCTAQPGAKPRAPNLAAIVAAIRLARAADMNLVDSARFLRKHYFYPDLPANYQRTSEPIATGGSILGVRLREVHVEEDPGAYDLASGLVDDNRAGVSLLELVTEPDMKSAEEARAFLRELRLILDHLGIANRAAGVKADCNVSTMGERVELKNVSGFRNVERAIEAEIARQEACASAGEPIVRETRGFDEDSGRSVRLRVKETEADYRYFPDPDVAPVHVAALARELPVGEAPSARRARLIAATGAPAEEINVILEQRELADALDAMCDRGLAPLEVHRFLLRDVRGELESRGLRFAGARVTATDLATLLEHRVRGGLTPHQTTRLLRLALDGGDMAAALATEAGASAGDLDAQARAVVAENAKAAADYRAGKAPALHFLVGALMKRTKGRADIEAARAAVMRALE